MRRAFVLICILIALMGCNRIDNKKIELTTNFESYGKINPNAPKETGQWGQLAGEWDCISMDLDTRNKTEAKWYSNRATWKWEYVLGGHAVLNQWWQEDTSPNPITKEYFATGMFIFNPKTTKWEAVVMNSRPHKISPKFEAEYRDGTIQMHDGTGKWLVTFYDIQENSFQWKYEILSDNGEWEPISKISAKRKKI